MTLKQLPKTAAEHHTRFKNWLLGIYGVIATKRKNGDYIVRTEKGFMRYRGCSNYCRDVKRAAKICSAIGVPLVTAAGWLDWVGDHAMECQCKDCRDYESATKKPKA